MKQKLVKKLSLLLALALQVMPFVRSLLPSMSQGLAPSTWAIVFRWAVGTAGVLGYDAISSASSVSISPPTATIGVFYSGTITYSGGHAGSVRACTLSNYVASFTCLSSTLTLVPGLTVTYGGGNTCTVSGTPTGSPSTNIFTMGFYSGSTCGSGDHDIRSTSFVVTPSGGGATAPSIVVVPQSTIAQVGSDVILSGGAIGNPTPNYYWKQGANFIPNATNNTLTISSIQLASAGIYSLVASNSAGSPSAACYVTVCQSPGTNVFALDYTNYYPAAVPLTLYTAMTNVPVATNTYQWEFNGSPTGAPKTPNWTFTPQPRNSGTYQMVFNSVVPTNALIGTNNTIVYNQAYYSYWAFGYSPGVTTAPTSVTTNAGFDVTFHATVTGSAAPPTQALPTAYQTTVLWYKDGTDLVAVQPLEMYNATGNSSSNVSLTLPSVTTADAGSYTVVCTNEWGSITSSPAVLAINSSSTAPSITTQPSPQSVLAGQNASFTVAATGTDPLTYQWKKDGVGNLSNGGIFAGVDTSHLTLTGVGLGDAGNYYVTISNVAGSITSTTNSLTVSLPPAVSLVSDPSGSTVLSASTVPGIAYVVESASSLADPTVWTPVITNTAPLSGLVLFTNTTGNAEQYFRLRFP